MFYPTSYFAPSYFPLLDPHPLVIPSSSRFYVQSDAFAAMVDILRRSGRFAEVLFAISSESTTFAADRYPFVVVIPGTWSETDDANPSSRVHQASFQLILAVRENDPVQGFHSLDRLTLCVQAAIEGSSLGGGCIAARTRLYSGAIDSKAVHPELRVRITGEFSYTRPVPPLLT